MSDKICHNHLPHPMFDIQAPDAVFGNAIAGESSRQYGQGLTIERPTNVDKFADALLSAADRDVVLLPPPHQVARLVMDSWRDPADPTTADAVMSDARQVPFFKLSPLDDRTRILGGLESIIKSTPSLVEFAEDTYQRRVLHLSLAGSAIFKANPGDLDFNVVVEGSLFDYSEVFRDTHPALFSEQDIVRKKSFITFGHDDITRPTGIDDSIQTPGYLHQDMIARELLVYPWRNVLLYGHDVELCATESDVLRRIVTGIAFARRTLQGEVPRYAEPEVRVAKSTARLSEAEMLLKAIASAIDKPTSWPESTAVSSLPRQ